ncbi:MAG: cobyrinate a,c-diamide synthase [Pseudoruegeria sp.]
MSNGIILSAPSSGAGKTTLTLGLLRALKQRGLAVRSAKSGPDYIDPRFHTAASGQDCINLDAWAMSADRIRGLASGVGPLIVEGAMGLFDGAPPDGKGATADLARQLRLPVVLVVEAARLSHSIAAIVAGFTNFDPDIQIAGVILNKVGSARHEAMLRRALSPLGIPVLGAIPRSTGLSHPSRHLGLIQADEHKDLESFLNAAAEIVSAHIDIDQLQTLFAPIDQNERVLRHRPPAQTIAVAKDAAFGFCYPHSLADWRAQGAEINFFSPLLNEPAPKSEFIYLPGGYPELHAGPLSSAHIFMESLRQAAAQNIWIYGECGGYMTLGDGMIDANNERHEMAGLLRLETSFASRKLHLGYRHLTGSHPLFDGNFYGHEFHYASTLKASGKPLFKISDAEERNPTTTGLQVGSVCGSYAHVIDPA